MHPLYISPLVNNTNLNNGNIKNMYIGDVKILMEFLGCTHHRFLDYIHCRVTPCTLQPLFVIHTITAYGFND